MAKSRAKNRPVSGSATTGSAAAAAVTTAAAAGASRPSAKSRLGVRPAPKVVSKSAAPRRKVIAAKPSSPAVAIPPAVLAHVRAKHARRLTKRARKLRVSFKAPAADSADRFSSSTSGKGLDSEIDPPAVLFNSDGSLQPAPGQPATSAQNPSAAAAAAASSDVLQQISRLQRQLLTLSGGLP